MTEHSFNISLIICTYNRDKYLSEALDSIKAQTIDSNKFQLIIVDNNSTDNTAAISKKFIIDYPNLNAKYCFEENKGLSFARNRGIAEADASIISYIDDDVILPPEYLETVMNFFTKYSPAVGMGGKVIPKYEDGKEPVWMNKYLNGFVAKVDYGNNIKKFDEHMRYPAGCNMTYKKNTLEKVGGFNNELKFRSDDKYIFYKIKTISDEIYYLPDAWLYHYIDRDRLQMQNFKKLFLKTGNEEKKRITSEQGTPGVIKKLIEFTFKFGASLLLFIIFLLKGQYVKGKYVVISQWCTLKGFLQKEVFVR
ncbi:MAG: glycosyltransferase family A protein [Panacibacter sp.]